MKNLIKIITIFILLFSILGVIDVNAGIQGLDKIQGVENITDHSLQTITASGNIADDIKDVGFRILTIIKYIISGVLVLFIVYTGVQMIMSFGSDEEELSKAKTQLRYTLMGLAFINIPGSLYKIFVSDKGQIDGSISGTWSSQLAQQEESIFINTQLFDETINGGIVVFIEATIFTIAVFMIVMAGINIILSAGKEEEVTEAKNKIGWSLAGLVFIGFIEGWQSLVYNGKISDGANLFQTIEELALFFAGPVAIFFLTLAGYYYITSNGDEEKVKKAKSIIINTVIATVILLASHSFLKDLITLNIN